MPAESKELEKRIEALERHCAAWRRLFAQPTDKFQVGVAEAMLFANNEELQK